MKRKYWVPALERAHLVLEMIANEPGKHKLTDFCKQLNISKSTMFSLLQTMEALNWIKKEVTDTYRLSFHFGLMGHAFFEQFDLVDTFKKEAIPIRDRLQESVQLAVLERDHIVYIAKLEAPNPVQMVSGPGVKFPAHATGLGKALLAEITDEEFDELYPEETLPRVTDFTIDTKTRLREEIRSIREKGYALDIQEGVMGFCCAAAPLKKMSGETHAAVSISMPIHHWERKKEEAVREIRYLAGRLSFDY